MYNNLYTFSQSFFDLYGLYLPNMNLEFQIFVDVGTVCILYIDLLDTVGLGKYENPRFEGFL